MHSKPQPFITATENKRPDTQFWRKKGPFFRPGPGVK